MAIKIITNKSFDVGTPRNSNQIEYIVIHNTGCSTKMNPANFSLQGNASAGYIIAHYYVDENNIYQGNNPLKASRHCERSDGGSLNPDCPARNSNSIGIEMCDSGTNSGQVISEGTENNTIWLCKTLIQQYPSIKGIYRHTDVCTPNWKTCPKAFIGKNEVIAGIKCKNGVDNGSTRFANFKTKVGLNNTGTEPVTSNSGDTFLDIIQFLINEGIKNKWIYDQTASHPVTYGGSIYKVRPDCSGLVTAALQMLYNDQTISCNSDSLVNDNDDLLQFGMSKFQFTSISDLQPGDILARRGSSSGHVEVYAGNGKDYNWGTTECIQNGTLVTTSTDWQVVWRGQQNSTSGTNTGGAGTPTSLFASLSSDQTSAIAEANSRILEMLNEQGVEATEEAGYVKMDFSKTIKDIVKYTNVHKIDGLQYHPNAMTRKDFKQDYIVIVRKKLYFAGSVTNEENYLRLYVLDNWNSITTNHSVESNENSASVTLTGETRVTCINNESSTDYPDYETMLNSLLSIDDEGESNGKKWRMSDVDWNSTTSDVDFKSLMKARQAKYGWRYAEKCDFEPMDEIIIYSKSRYTKDESGKYIFRRIFFGFIESVQKTFSAGNAAPRIQISAKDQFKLLKQSYVNQSPSFFPGRFNNGKVDISFDTDKFGSYKLNEPLAYGLEDATEEQLKKIQMQYTGQNVFTGQYADDILKQLCSAAGIPDKYLNTRIEPIKKVPYLTSAFATSFDMYSASFEQRSQFASKIAEICFMEFFFDEEGNATFKIPTYVLGTNSLYPNNDNTEFALQQFEGIQDKLVNKDNSIQVVNQFCTLVEPILYTTTKGETLRQISQKFYNTINYAVEIQSLNIGQCQNYNTVKPLPEMTILILKFDTQDKNARAEYRNLMANNTVTSYANRLYNQSIDEFNEQRKMTMAYLTDPYIRKIPDEDIITFTMTDSDQNIYTAIDVQAETFMGVYDNNPMTKIKRTVGQWDAILKFGVRVAPPVSTPFIGSEDDAELLGNMMLLKSYGARYKASLQMIEDCDIKVGTPIRLFTYDEHPNAEDEEYVQIADLDQKQSIYYVNSINRSISTDKTSTMTLDLTAGRMLGQESIFDIMDSLYIDFYKEPKDQDFIQAWGMFNSTSDNSSTNGGSTTGNISISDLPSTIPGLENDTGNVENAKKIYIYTLNSGLNQTIEMACGWLGNAYAESRFNPDEVTGSHHGIYQWSDAPGDGRWDGSTTLDGQLNLWKTELQGSEKKTNQLLQEATTKTPENYADIIRLNYERCGTQGMGQRRKAARAFYNAWKDVQGTSTNTESNNNNTNTQSTSQNSQSNSTSSTTTKTQQQAKQGDNITVSSFGGCEIVKASTIKQPVYHVKNVLIYKDNGLAQVAKVNRWAVVMTSVYGEPGQEITIKFDNGTSCACIIVDNYRDKNGNNIKTPNINTGRITVGFIAKDLIPLPDSLKHKITGITIGKKHKITIEGDGTYITDPKNGYISLR